MARSIAESAQQWAAPPSVAIRFYWIAALCTGVLLAFLTPPFQVPDEPQHYYRSYQLSRLELRPEVQGGQAGGALPESLPRLIEQQLGSLAHHQDRRLRAMPLARTLDSLGQPLQPEISRFVEFTGSALYAPIAYAPQALGMAVGRQLDFSPLGLLYAARIANVLATVAVIAWALQQLTTGRLFAMAVAMLPMTQFMIASASPDALTIAGGFIVAALVQRLFDGGRWSLRQQLSWIVGGLLLCAVKVVYLPIMACGAALLAHRETRANGSMRRAVMWQAAGVGLILLIVGLWFWLRASGVTGGGGPAGVDAAAQIAALREKALMPLRIVVRSLYKEGGFLWESMIGRLGWLNVDLPWVLHGIAGLALALGLTEASRRPRPSTWSSLFVFGLCFASISLIELALYIAWTPVGAYSAQGVQGRYFLPLLPLLGLALIWRIPAFMTISGGRLSTPLFGLLGALSLGTVAAIVIAYQLY